MTSPLTLEQLQELAATVGFPDPNLAAAVAMAESGGDPAAYGDAQYGGSYGLWQINLPAHPEYSGDPSVLYDPTTNAQAAFKISSSGTNWKPWTTYRTGAFQKWYTPPPPSSGPLAGGAAGALGLALVGAGYLTRDAWLPYVSAGVVLVRGWLAS